MAPPASIARPVTARSIRRRPAFRERPTGISPRCAWCGRNCRWATRALLDPARGGMKPGEFIAHFHTGLVRWAWSPRAGPRGERRDAPPIPYEQFLALTREW